MTTIIALTGPAGCGKNLVGEIMTTQMLRRDPNVKLRSLSFASPIKEAVAAILGCRVEAFEDRSFKEGSLLDSHNLDTSPRIMMQLMGDQYARQMIDDQIWIKIAEQRLDTAEDQGVDYMFITDCRYSNEQEWILDNGGVVIYIDRQDAAPVAAHASEAGLSNPPCFIIDNNGSIESLRTEVLELATIVQPLEPVRLSIDDCSPSEWDAVRRAF
jgi:hypothetical protein